MGALLCPCSRSSSKVRPIDTDEQDDATKAMLKDTDKTSLTTQIPKKPGSPYGSTDKIGEDKVVFTTLSTNDKHKTVRRVSSHEEGETNLNISGMDDTGTSHIINHKFMTHNINNNDNNDENDKTNKFKSKSKSKSSKCTKSKSTEPIFLPSSSSTLVVDNAGFEIINGEYRWFLHAKKWCYFTEDGKQYSIEGNIDKSIIYTELQKLQSNKFDFRWSDSIDSCWIISEMNDGYIYYASPQEYHDKIPSNFSWISVHGSNPLPIVTQNIGHDCQFPEDEDDNLTFNTSQTSLHSRHPSRNANKSETLNEYENEDESLSDLENQNDNDNDNDDNENEQLIKHNENTENEEDEESEVSAMSE